MGELAVDDHVRARVAVLEVLDAVLLAGEQRAVPVPVPVPLLLLLQVVNVTGIYTYARSCYIYNYISLCFSA